MLSWLFHPGCRVDGATEIDLTDGQPHTVYSPNYPNAYPNAFICVWIFHATEGKRVRFETIDLSIAESRLLFGTGDEANVAMAEYYYRDEVLFGKWLNNITIPSDKAWMELFSESGSLNRGFKIEVLQVDAENSEFVNDSYMLCYTL